ncbi:MAG: DUF5658 family protein [Planctomycetota bacterium]
MNSTVDRSKPGKRPAASRRNRGDRRLRPTPVLSRYWFVGRRKRGRRAGEGENIYVDRYTALELFLILGILVLSLLDMVFTLIHLEAGGTEANPLMAWTLAWGGNPAFTSVKLVSTLLGLFVLLIHVRFRRVKTLLGVAFTLYAGILLFHTYLSFVRIGVL